MNYENDFYGFENHSTLTSITEKFGGIATK